MTLKSIFLAGACVIGLGGPAAAFDQSTIDAIAGELAAQGYTKLEVKIGPNGAKVEAHGPNGAVERYYDDAGNLIKEERGSNGGGFAGAGSGSDDNGFSNDDSNDDGFGNDDTDDDSNDDSNDDSGNDDDGSDDD